MAGLSPWVSHSAPGQSTLAGNHCLASARGLQALKQAAEWKRKRKKKKKIWQSLKDAKEQAHSENG